MKSTCFPRYFAVSALLLLAALLAGCGSSTPSPSGPIPAASTTVQAETGNNTSTANSFPGQKNGNAPASNVSKLAIASLLYSGATTKIYATWLGWFGLNNHMSVGYNSDTAAQVHTQVQDMISRGMAGAIADWYGTPNTFIDGATMLLKKEAEASSGQFEFAIMEDRGSLAPAAKSNGCVVTSQLISDLNYIASQYESSPAYIRVNGRPVVYFFDVDAYYIDWPTVLSSVQGNPLVLIRGANGFTKTTADGGYSAHRGRSSASPVWTLSAGDHLSRVRHVHAARAPAQRPARIAVRHPRGPRAARR